MNAKRFQPTLFVLCAILLVSFGGTTAVAAQSEPSGLTVDAQAGFDGFYKGDFWFPVTINLANDGPPIEGEIQVIKDDPIPNERLTFRAPISLPTQSNKQVTLYVYTPDPTPNLDVVLVDEAGEVVLETTTNRVSRLPTSDLLYGVVSPDPGEFSFLENVTGGRSNAEVAFLTLADLPEISTAWNALDVLVLNDVDTAQLSPAQLQALDAWVNTGGQLIVTGGANWQKTAAGLEDLLPVTISGSESVDDLPLLAETLAVPFRDPGPYLLTTSSLARGTMLYNEDGLPILAQRPYGRGSVFFLALDPRFAPLLDWDGTEMIFETPARLAPGDTLWGKAPSESYAARSAVESLPDLSLPSVWQMILFLLIYTAVVGPLNYIILKQRNRLELAWLTIPLLILGFTAVTYFTGFQLRGNQVLLNQMSVAYSHTDGEQARVHSVIGLYSPRRATYDLVVPADTLARPFTDSFGAGFGGSSSEAITFSNDNSVDGVRVDVSDVEAFSAQTDRTAVGIDGQGTISPGVSRVNLEATIQNNGDITLEDSVLLFGNSVISLGDLTPGETENINQIISALGSSGSTAAFPGGNTPLTSKASDILGLNYYSDPILYPRYQFLEALEGELFSGPQLQLPANAAVLLGWSDEPLIELDVNNAASTQQDTTLYFVEIPLSQVTESGDAVTVPPFLLNWSVLADSGISGAAIYNLRLNGGWIEFEYEPWDDYESLTVEQMDIVVEQGNSTSYLVPTIKLWNWMAEEWQEVEGVNWGKTAVADPTAYLGANNAVRLRIEDRENSYNHVIQNIYPSLTGSTE